VSILFVNFGQSSPQIRRGRWPMERASMTLEYWNTLRKNAKHGVWVSRWSSSRILAPCR
jgi:hypothetical protein